MSFLKPSVCIRIFLVFCALFGATIFNSCKQLASFYPSVDGARTAASSSGSAFSAPTGMKASQGLKQKISLEWNAVSGAKCYEVYCATSSTAEFKKIYETDKNYFDDKGLPAGRTLYYKVRAIKSNGTQSPFSTIEKGTTLAQPMISGGEVSENSVKIQWFMENARGINGQSNYEDDLYFDVYCVGGDSEQKPKTFAAATFTDSSYECDFDNLAGSTEYKFYIQAYLASYQNDTEKSPTVTNYTLTSYTPLAPEFNASEGTSARGVWLYVTLPEMCMVQTETAGSQNKKVDVEYPLYFKIERKPVDGSSFEEIATVYYNGEETLTKEPVTYKDSGEPYKVGAKAAWFDAHAGLQGGVKYEYKIRSFVDTNYSNVLWPAEEDDGKRYVSEAGSLDDESKIFTAVGWKSAHPTFEVKYNENADRTLSEDGTKVLSVNLGFEAAWNDLGKAENYKFAIKQNRKTSEDDENSPGTDVWLENNGSKFFETLEEVNEVKVKFGSENGGLSEDDKGLYSYTLYIVSKDSESADDEEKVLCSTKAIREILVTSDVDLPEANLTVEDGYKDHVVLIISSLEEGADYIITRTKIKDLGSSEFPEVDSFTLDISEDEKKKGKFEYPDEVAGNCEYSYVLKVARTNGGNAYALSEPMKAETLGTPEVSSKIKDLSYDSVTISFNGVLAAKTYTVTLGKDEEFGGGDEFSIDKDDEGLDSKDGLEIQASSGATANVKRVADNFTVIIKSPSGYDDATLAGRSADAVVTAYSGVEKASSTPVQVNVLGPALVNALVTGDMKEDSISITWKEVEDAEGYLIRRVMYSDVAMKTVGEGSDITYYYDVSSKKVTCENADTGGRATVKFQDSRFTLIDTYQEANPNADANLQEYQNAQAKVAWGLPFRYVVLPVKDKKDFAFASQSLALASGKVAYKNLDKMKTEPTATWGYGLFVDAEKVASATTQKVEWTRPFYGDKLTPNVYRRKFNSGKPGAWEALDYNIDRTATSINYPVSGDDRYRAWEYAVKYVNSPSENIAPSYVNYLADSDHNETRYAYADTNKVEKRNKGYLLAMKMTAGYGGTDGTNSAQANYYSEKVDITPWYYDDRTLGPDNVELQILCLDLAGGWQVVGALDVGITKFTGESLEDTTLEFDDKNQRIKLRPTEISTKLNGKGTTNGPLKVLRSAKHYYGLKLTRDGSDPMFDEYNYKVYGYRQITDEEIFKSTMLVLAQVIEDSKMEDNWAGTVIGTSTTVSGFDGGLFAWGKEVRVICHGL